MKVRPPYWQTAAADWFWMAALCYVIVGFFLALPGWGDTPTWARWLIFAASPLVVAVFAALAMAVQFAFLAVLVALTRKD
jgi:hypothetical protein